MDIIVISDPTCFPGEIELINQLFAAGMRIFHLRKPDIDKSGYEKLIMRISPQYHERLVLHHYHELCKKFTSIKRLHYSERLRRAGFMKMDGYILSTSIHHPAALDEVKDFDYTFYGPVFNSISKPGYTALCKSDLILSDRKTQLKVIAIGGIDVDKITEIRQMGFDGIALLGAMWNHKELAIQNFNSVNIKMNNTPSHRPKAISIAGFDPSGGAGILADIKCFEQNEVYGFGVCSSLTVQNDIEFIKNEWISAAGIIEQIEALFRRFQVSAVKIGLIRDISVLSAVINYLKKQKPDLKIVLDPVLKATAGYNFHDWADGLTPWIPVLQQIDLITPNYMEMMNMGRQEDVFSTAEAWSAYCPVLLKGGHLKSHPGTDFLYADGVLNELRPGVDEIYQKHGSGCVLSAAITAGLAHKKNLLNACVQAKRYTERFLNSNDSLLGYHQLQTKL